jgi:diaminohydroxyphosphoribosylaminopyrimidine deaminase/5-amino-6-(5-phosphoribosylamino)uracil reductase
MVGALVVKDHVVVGKGYHRRYGGPHAEILALRQAKEGARGATLYVTLEPCSSRGKTPPCTDAILRSGAARVVVGAVDPDPRHRGKGIELLKRGGVAAELLEDRACEPLLIPFKAALERDRPYVILKWAMTLDGRVAAKDGSSKWISGAASRHAVHRLRGHVDAILVGQRTVLLDDPRLNCRRKGVPLTPVRVVLDPRLEVPATATLFQQAAGGRDPSGRRLGPVWILAAKGADSGRAEALRGLGVEVLLVEDSQEDRQLFLTRGLSELKRKGIHRLLVEGGSQVFTGLVEAKLADQVVAFVAPKIVGGGSALSPVEGEGRAPMSAAHRLTEISVKRSGEDMMMVGFFS